MSHKITSISYGPYDMTYRTERIIWDFWLSRRPRNLYLNSFESNGLINVFVHSEILYLEWFKPKMEHSLSSSRISTIFYHVTTYLTTVDDDLLTKWIIECSNCDWLPEKLALVAQRVDKCSSPESNSSYLLTRRTVLSLPNEP